MSDPRDESNRRSPRRWVVPPGLGQHDEPFDGWNVVDELRTGLGAVLWQTMRDVEMWAASPPEARARLFSHGTLGRRREWIQSVGAPGPLREALETLTRVLDARHPPDPGEVAAAATAVSRWAGDGGLPRVALAFAQTAAIAAPERPAAAYLVGLLARRGAQYRRAETWFRRALALGRRTRDWGHYGLACIGLGTLYRQRGDYPAARTWFLKALRVSRRHGLWEVRPRALHDLFCVAANAGQVDEAETWARRAFRAYGRRHPRLVALAHDVARFWLLQGKYHDAMRIFRASLPHLTRLPERRLAVSNLARAAAGLGDRMSFAEMWSETWRLVDDYEDTQNVPEALITLAEGAAVLGDPDRGQLAASYALNVAIQRAESEQRILAENLLEELRSVRRGPPPPRQDVLAAGSAGAGDTEALAADLVEALTADHLVEP